MRRYFLVPAILCLALFLTGSAETKVDTSHKYFLLATTRTATMQSELEAGAKAGYRIVVGSPTSGAEMAVLMERQAEGKKPVEYKLLATTRTSTMEKELNATAKDGFRLLPRTMISKPPAFMGSIEIVCILERDPNVQMQYHYKLLATSRTSTLQKEIDEAIAAHYTLAGMVSRGEHMVIMEKESPR